MIDYTDKIPNNVDLGRDRVLQRALEHWQPAYLSWWYDMGPNESHNFEVTYAPRSASNPTAGPQFDYVKMPEYRWGIFLQPRDEKRQVNFGIHKGQPPGKTSLANIVPFFAASWSPKATPNRLLSSSRKCSACPALRSTTLAIFSGKRRGRPSSVGMVYLLHRYFGRDGREEAESLLARRSGDTDNPRILERSTSLLPTGSPSTCSLSSLTATANFSYAPWQNPARSPRAHLPIHAH